MSRRRIAVGFSITDVIGNGLLMYGSSLFMY